MNRSPTDLPLQDQLVAYFELDQRVRAMRSRLDAAVRRRDAQQNKLAQLRQQAAELTKQQKLAQAHAANLENEVKAMDQRIESLRERMNNVTSNKEYSALLVEVNTLKADKAKIEDQMLESMGKAEESVKQSADLAERVGGQEKLVAGANAEVAEAESEIGGQLTELTAQRDAAAQPISPEIRKMFDRLSDTYDGEAMAQIEEQDRRRMEYTCGGCYTLLPVEAVNALITKPDQIVTCGTCQRILFVAAELRDGLADAKS